MTLSSLISYAQHVQQERRLARGVTAAELAAAPADQQEELRHLRGRANERRALRALRSTPLPIWVVHYRPAGPSEDRRGIDLVVICDDHRAYGIQLKSSNRGAIKFAEQRPTHCRDIGVVVVHDFMPPRKLAGRILAKVDEVRRAVAWR